MSFSPELEIGDEQEAFPNINEIIGLIKQLAPESLKQLKARYPEHERVLAGGHELKAGLPGDATTAQIPSRREAVSIRLEVVKVLLYDALPKCDLAVQKARRSLRFADRCELCAEVVTLISTSSVLVCLLQRPESSKKAFVAGLFALAGSLAGLGARWLRRPPAGVAGSLQDHFQNLLRLQGVGVELRAEFRVWEQVHGTLKQGLSLIAAAQKLSQEIRLAVQ